MIRLSDPFLAACRLVPVLAFAWHLATNPAPVTPDRSALAAELDAMSLRAIRARYGVRRHLSRAATVALVLQAA